jgi:hypothetical protein
VNTSPSLEEKMFRNIKKYNAIFNYCKLIKFIDKEFETINLLNKFIQLNHSIDLFALLFFKDLGMNGDLSDAQDSRSSNDSGDLDHDDDNSLDSERALNLVSINLLLL